MREMFGGTEPVFGHLLESGNIASGHRFRFAQRAFVHGTAIVFSPTLDFGMIRAEVRDTWQTYS